MYSIIIPSYNEPDLDVLIARIQRMYDFEIIVIDDGSTPRLALKDTCQKVSIIRNGKNRGKGYSILRGIKESLERGFKYSIVVDADFQHAPEDIDKFTDCIGDCELIIGYRKFKSPMPFLRIASNRITSFIISVIISQRIKDSQCGFRMYKNSLFKNLIFRERGFQFESEFLLKVGKDIRIKQVPIKTIYGNNTSHINKTKDTYKFIKLIVKHIVYGK